MRIAQRVSKVHCEVIAFNMAWVLRLIHLNFPFLKAEALF